MTPFQLLREGGLRVSADAGALPAVRRWLPLSAEELGAAAEDAAELRVSTAAGPPGPAPGAAPGLRLGTAAARVEGDTAVLWGTHGLRGEVDLASRRAALTAPAASGDGVADVDAAWEVYSACTLSCALLLGRMGRALVHAAAAVDRAGGCWLLVGDALAGKTTTCVNLVAAGWRYLSDDHVVLSAGRDGGVMVEGWPRPFHLDEGFAAGAPSGVRMPVDPRERWPGQWLRAAPLAGLLFPRVEAERPTALEPAHAADALAALLRQSPWLLADRVAAAGVLALLRRAASARSHGLRLGLDTYADPGLLAARLEPAVAGTAAV
jgi:hypothetical protein